MLEIGNLKLTHPFILAPMASVADLPFRIISRKFGCEFAFVEMLNARSVAYHSDKTRVLLRASEEDRPLGVQLLGCEEEYIKRALDIIRGYKFDILDFNAACPKKKVVRRGEGAALLKNPAKLKKLLKLAVKNSDIPVTVKIRTGWDKNSLNAKDVALSAEDSGISALFIHGRTRFQDYSGEVDYDSIKKVKSALKIPVIGSGNVFSPELAKKMLDETGCDGVLIARGALGNPWIFKETEYFLKKGKTRPRPKMAEIKKTMLEHFYMCAEFYGERNGVLIFRKFFSWYTKGFGGVRHLREKVSFIKTKAEMAEVIKNLSCEI